MSADYSSNRDMLELFNERIISGVRAVLFDAVGTLIHPDPPVREVYRAAGQRFGSSLSADQIESRFRAAFARHFAATIDSPDASMLPPTSHDAQCDGWRLVVGDVFDDVGKSAQPRLFDALWAHFARPSSWRLFPDVLELWGAALRRKLTVGIASNFDDRLLDVVRGLEDIRDCRHIFPSSQIGYSKPDPRYFRAIEDQLSLPPHSLLLIGDDPIRDMAGATRAGWRYLHVDRFNSQ